jgi:hypothetical protein
MATITAMRITCRFERLLELIGAECTVCGVDGAIAEAGRGRVAVGGAPDHSLRHEKSLH